MPLVFLLLYCLPFAKQDFDVAKLHLEWRLLQNSSNANPEFLAAITFENTGDSVFPAAGWKIYFSLRYHGQDLKALNSPFEITHVNGDLFYIAPSAAFTGLGPNQKIVMPFAGRGRIANYNDAPSGLFWVADKEDRKGVSLDNFTILSADSAETAGRLAAHLFNENSGIRDIPSGKLPPIFPTPRRYQREEGRFIWNSAVGIVADRAFVNEAGYLADECALLFGKRPMIREPALHARSISLLKNDTLAADAYLLDIQPKGITITAGSGSGIFYAIQSLKSLLSPDAWRASHDHLVIPCVSVRDTPAFPVRALMLDISRHFQSKEEIMRILDLLSFCKLNVLHLHFSDDEGWRLQIPGLPELTTVGANRGYPFDNNQRLQPSYGSGPDAEHSDGGSGYYTAADFIEILKYATARYIRVIPEIETPGHARAAIKSMDARYLDYMDTGDTTEAERYLLHDPHDSSRFSSAQYYNDNVIDPALPSSYRFIEKVVDEIQSMYKQAGAPLSYIHMGGDEVPKGAWERSTAVQDLMRKDPSLRNTGDLRNAFFIRVNKLLKSKGLSLYGWEELVTGGPDEKDSRKVPDNSPFKGEPVLLDAWANAIGGGNEAIPYQLANAGYKVVLSCIDYFYFDLAYQPLFDEPGDGWVGYLDIDKTFGFIPYDYYRNAKEDLAGNLLPPGYFAGKEPLTQAGKRNIMGLQGAMWQENIATRGLLEYMLVPRLLALAERAWASDPGRDQHSLSIFLNVLGKKELPALCFYHGGYAYRIPMPGVMVSHGKVMCNAQMPGFSIHYTADGSAPGNNSRIYTSPIADKGIIKLTLYDKAGHHGKTVAIENK